MLGIGIVGLPNVGKSTLFNAITQAGALAANYPFATIDKNVGVVAVPDARLNALRDLYTRPGHIPPVHPTTVEFIDIAGLVKGAHKGEGLGNQFLANIREVAVIAHVVRCFEDPDVIHVAGRVDPLADIETIETELALADLASLERRVERLRRSAKGNKDDAELLEVAQQLLQQLSEGNDIRQAGIDIPAELGLLSAKPVIYVCNVSEEDVASGNDFVAAVRAHAASKGADVVVISALAEPELSELPADEAAEFMQELRLEESGLERLIHTGYRTLQLITYLTSGEKEVRAWTVPVGCKAPQAAGVIHSDFERGFIRAEVISTDRLLEAGSLANARSRGWLRTEGKEYVVQDGDVIHFLFNV
jgi:GTP-binding protein YchF